MGESNGLSPARTARLRRAVSGLLLVIPVALGLAVPLYQRTGPTLIDIPFFYWFQLAMAVLAAIATSVVYRILFSGDDGREGEA